MAPSIAAHFPEVGGHSYGGINPGLVHQFEVDTFCKSRDSKAVEYANFCELSVSEGDVPVLLVHV